MRRGIVFQLAPILQQLPAATSVIDLDLVQLRKSAEDAGRSAPEQRTEVALRNFIKRAAAIRDYAIARADGHCELCDRPAPFKLAGGVPYLEVHHIDRLSDGGPDTTDGVAAVCPNCHREVHFSAESVELNARLRIKIASREEEIEGAISARE